MARTRFSIATFNLYNLNRPGMPVYTDTDGWSEEQYKAKIDWTASVIRRVGADAWGFQELWHRDALADVFALAGLRDEYTLLVPPDHIGQRIVCAGAVRNEILVGDPVWIDQFPDHFRLESSGDDPQTPQIRVEIDAFSRPVLSYRIRPRRNGAPISVFVAHLKSKGPTKVYREAWYRAEQEYYRVHSEGVGSALSTIRRTAEALALRMMLTDAFKGNDEPAIVLGDRNDGADSNTLGIVTGEPRFLTSPLYPGGSDTDLYSMGRLLALRSFRDVYFTHTYQGSHESLDHILVSQELYDSSRKRQWAFRRAEILNDHLGRDDHKESGTGDHGIVSVEFEYWPVTQE